MKHFYKIKQAATAWIVLLLVSLFALPSMVIFGAPPEMMDAHEVKDIAAETATAADSRLFMDLFFCIAF